MRLKVDDISDGKVYLDGSGIYMELSKRSVHLKGMDLKEGDFVEVTLKKEIKPVKKKVAVKKKPVKKKVAKKKKKKTDHYY